MYECDSRLIIELYWIRHAYVWRFEKQLTVRDYTRRCAAHFAGEMAHILYLIYCSKDAPVYRDNLIREMSACAVTLCLFGTRKIFWKYLSHGRTKMHVVWIVALPTSSLANGYIYSSNQKNVSRLSSPFSLGKNTYHLSDVTCAHPRIQELFKSFK